MAIKQTLAGAGSPDRMLAARLVKARLKPCRLRAGPCRRRWQPRVPGSDRLLRQARLQRQPANVQPRPSYATALPRASQWPRGETLPMAHLPCVAGRDGGSLEIAASPAIGFQLKSTTVAMRLASSVAFIERRAAPNTRVCCCSILMLQSTLSEGAP